MSKDSLRARAGHGKPLFGVLLRMPSEELVEMSAIAGFDFILIDCEHGPNDLVSLRQHMAAAAVHDVPVIVRIGQDDSGMILRALDQGAQGIVAPHIDSAAQAHALVKATHYPPLGERGFATYSRAGRFGTVDPTAHREWFLENTLLVAMIESPRAVAAVDEIAAVPGIDSLMVGPADLAASSGPEDPPLAESIARVADAAAAAGKHRLDIVSSPANASRAVESGATLVVYNLAATVMDHFATLLSPR